MTAEQVPDVAARGLHPLPAEPSDASDPAGTGPDRTWLTLWPRA